MTIEVGLLQVSPDLGGSEFGVLGMVSLGPGSSDIDGHQISYIRHDGGAKFVQKNFHVIGSAEPPRRGVPVVSNSVTN